MDIDELDFRLPSNLIAHAPAPERGASRLMVLERGSPEPGEIGRFDELFMQQLRPDDTIVINDTRVLHARVHVTRPTGGKGELLLEPVSQRDNAQWRAMAKPAKRLKEEMLLTCSDGREIRCIHREEEGTWIVELPVPLPEAPSWLTQVGELPFPPYVENYSGDPNRYQTVFGREAGSVAAPTASLHIDTEMLEQLRNFARVVPITLHVGAGTFLPVRAETLEEHTMHFERYEVPHDTYEAVARAMQEGTRVVAIGTTVVRTLETVFEPALMAAHERLAKSDQSVSGSTDLLISPGSTFHCVTALLTNFHLPKSTLLALVMAFHGVEETRAAYRQAIRERMRFFSFGDAMWIANTVGTNG